MAVGERRGQWGAGKHGLQVRVRRHARSLHLTNLRPVRGTRAVLLHPALSHPAPPRRDDGRGAAGRAPEDDPAAVCASEDTPLPGKKHAGGSPSGVPTPFIRPSRGAVRTARASDGAVGTAVHSSRTSPSSFPCPARRRRKSSRRHALLPSKRVPRQTGQRAPNLSSGIN